MRLPLSLDPRRIQKTGAPITTMWLLGDCQEARGKQDLWATQKPEILDVLREQAMIQSIESSNRIEGVTVDARRLRPLVIGRSRPRDRSEEELAGYRAALDWIFGLRRPPDITPELILHLHRMAQSSNDAGKWKERNNEIVEIPPSGEPVVRFAPLSARRTPAAVEALCARYHSSIEARTVPPLLLIATFVLDFLCIHPFRDGNGRVSRLLTSMLLMGERFEAPRFVSLERLVEDPKSEYFRVLKTCSQDWRHGRNEMLPWWNYFLAVLKNAYREFARQVETAGARPSKGSLVRQTALMQLEPFTLAALGAQVPSASPQLIRKELARLKGDGLVRPAGRGRGAVWTVARARKRN
ncbi:MAG: Fic family protein [Bryobacteraceae bacterium]